VASIARDYSNAGLSESEVALMAFAEKVASRANEIVKSDVDELRAHGFTDAEIFDIAAAAAARCFFSKLLDAMGAEPDAAYRELDPELQSTLTVGRPIEP
jgi:alkylhydroperoxidase family enzyme